MTGDTATGVKCDDFREATFANNTGELTVDQAGQGVPQRGKLELVRVDGGTWWISRVVEDGTC